jgi:hypothetical protein
MKWQSKTTEEQMRELVSGMRERVEEGRRHGGSLRMMGGEIKKNG